MQLHRTHRPLVFPTLALALVAIATVVIGAILLNRQLGDNERSRASDSDRQLASGLAHGAADEFARFHEDFVFSLTHLPYEEILTRDDVPAATIIPVRRFLSLNKVFLRQLIIIGPDKQGRTLSLTGENYFTVSELGPLTLPADSPDTVVVSGIVQAPDGSVRAYVAAVVDPILFWRDQITAFGLSHDPLWIHLFDLNANPLVVRHGAGKLTVPAYLEASATRQLRDDAHQGYEGRLVHEFTESDQTHTLVSAYVPTRIESWRGLLMISTDENDVLGPARNALGLITAIAGLLLLVLFTLFALFIRHSQRNQRELEASILRAEDSAQEAEAASRAKTAFLAMMSHELRTPLNSILGLSESLLERLHGPLNEKQIRYLGLVLNSGRHLLALINDILDLAKIEAGQMDVETIDCELHDVCDAALQTIQPLAIKRRQIVSRDLPSTRIRLRADPRRIRQILVNLLGNAVKFTPEGGSLGLRVIVQPGELRLIVWDYGIGIAADHLPNLFKPFVQLDNRLSREYSGTGLGLALVKQLASIQGGRVEVASQPGTGSTFTVILPWTPPPEPAPAPAIAPPPPVAPPAPAGTPPLVLVVEDTPYNVTALTEYLTAKGCRVEVAENGALAIEMTVRVRPSIILMDIQMPVMDGIEATRRIRGLPDPVLARVPIIAVTALVMPGDRETCLKAGADDYISKPFSPRDLHRRILELVSRPPQT